jgi:hypothetical protein
MEPMPFYDKKGVEIKEFAVIKIYHFTAALRRKKHYMYKWVRKNPNDPRYLVAYHLDSDKPNNYFNLSALSNGVDNICHSVEVVQSY